MESSHLKTIKPHSTIQLISPVFFFILFIYPAISTAERFKRIPGCYINGSYIEWAMMYAGPTEYYCARAAVLNC
jgi:hypothetical protein